MVTKIVGKNNTNVDNKTEATKNNIEIKKIDISGT